MRIKMPKLNRAHVLANVLLLALLGSALALLAISYATYVDATAELNERVTRLAELERRQQDPGARTASAAPRAAPASSFLEAQTPGLAAARLQAYVAEVASAQNARIESLGLEPTGDETADAVRVQVTLDLSLSALQSFLYALESATPYVFVDAITIQTTRREIRQGEEPPLRAVLGLRALWRRAAS